jgi:hypothetical protein
MINPLSLIFGGLVEAGKQLGSLWLTNKKAKIEGKIALSQALVKGDLDYNVAAQRASETSWKDEFLTLFTCGIFALCFIPYFQPAMKAGFLFLKDSVPDWFSYCFVGMYVAVYGLKGWKIFANK